MPEAIRLGGAGVDLSPRVARSATVAASPAAAAETVIASVTINQDLAVGLGVLVIGYAAVTIGTAGVSATWRIRRDSVAGTIIKASGAKTVAATELHDEAIIGIDTAPTFPGEVYVLTLTVASASAESTVSAVELVAVAI